MIQNFDETKYKLKIFWFIVKIKVGAHRIIPIPTTTDKTAVQRRRKTLTRKEVWIILKNKILMNFLDENCDGSTLALDSVCCENDNFLACPSDRPCAQYLPQSAGKK